MRRPRPLQVHFGQQTLSPASHLRLLEAVAGPETVHRAYREALAAGYLWHEFGDVNLLLP